MKKSVIIALIILLFGKITAQQTPADPQTETITITGATAHIGNGKIINNSVIIFEKGKLVTVGDVNSTNPKGKTINATGKHVYPGFIAPNTSLGLIEIDAVQATNDNNETGKFNPHIRSIIAYNSESKIIESCRPNGVLITQVTPRGGIISGTSSIVQLDAWNWEDATIKTDDGIHLNWPNPFKKGNKSKGETSGYILNKNYPKEVRIIQEYITQSRVSIQANIPDKHIPYSAMKGVFDNTKILYIHTANEKTILDAITFTKKNNIKKMVIVGGDEAYKTTHQLKQNNIPILLTRVHSLPNADDDDLDRFYKNAKLLSDAGILIGLQNSGDLERINVRNLPFQAGTAAAYGLDKEKALQLITGNNAKILGIDNFTGTLEVGKDATLFISKGDALDMRTNQLEKAFIQGRDISLETHQTKLWKKYSKKYGQ